MVSGVGSVLGEELESSPQAIAFEQEIRPLLLNRCVRCHGPEEQSSGLRLDTRRALLEGGHRGPAIDLSAPDQSLLLRALSYWDESLQMPPRGKLDEAAIAAVERWIEQGVYYPSGESLLGSESSVTVEQPLPGGEHWVWQPLADPPVPEGYRSLARARSH